jgi:hypothetical protein
VNRGGASAPAVRKENAVDDETDGGSGLEGSGVAPHESERVRVSQEELWRVKALAAEERLTSLDGKLAEANRLLEEARAALDSSEQRRAIERELAAQGAIDMELGSMLVESVLRSRPGMDVAGAVTEVRKRKPFLFRGRASGAMAASPPAGSAGLDRAAMDARQSGDRGAVLRYLRLKRGA